MKAVVLCGGRGTRLRPYTLSTPKAMLPLGSKPILEYTVEHLHRQGFKDVVFTVGHLKERVMNHFGNGKKFGLRINYSVEEGELGTAGSVTNARALIGSDDFVVIMGDQLTNLSYKKVIEFNRSHPGIATVALKRLTQPLQVGVAKMDPKTKRVTAFLEKPVVENLTNAAIYVFDKRVWKYMPERGDFAFDVLPKLLKDKQLYGYVFDDYWVDVGYIHEYEEINEAISLMDLIHSKK